MGDWDRSAGPPKPSAAAVFLQVGLGVVLVFVAHAVFLGALLAVAAAGDGIGGQVGETAAMLGRFGLFGLSLAQAIYVVPMVIGAAFVRRPIALGVLIGAGLTVLLQGGCYGLFFTAMSGASFH